MPHLQPDTATVAIRVIAGSGVDPHWTSVTSGDVTVWMKADLFSESTTVAAARIASHCSSRDGLTEPALTELLHGLDGHFAVLAQGPDWAMGAVDAIRSAPIFLINEPPQNFVRSLTLCGTPAALGRRLGTFSFNPDGVLSLAMAGYTLGSDSLYQGITQLQPGEAVLFTGTSNRLWRYRRYQPWLIDQTATGPRLKRRLAELTLGILDKTAKASLGRLVVPLSAGLDSRLIVSGLAHLGHRDVKCFTYGLANSYEAEAAKQIAAELGYTWRFVPYRPADQRRYWNDSHCRAYLNFSESWCSTPIVHDLPAVDVLVRDGYLQAGDLVLNGNSGDYISGMHIAAPLRHCRDDLTAEGRRRLVIDTMLNKHFMLWRSLATDDNRQRIAARLEAAFDEEGLDTADPRTSHGAYECLEFLNRQAKYVISRQRTYEFFNLRWYLPLWDAAYLDFWQTVPLEWKTDQRLYREMLEEENWGGVWQGPNWRFAKRVSPSWLHLPRLALKLLHAPLGAPAWHDFERRYLSYWMDLMAWQGIHPYLKVANDSRGARHYVAWHTEAYLNGKGIGWDGRPLAEP